MRLDALGERLVEVADVGSDEFDFSTIRRGWVVRSLKDEGASYELPSRSWSRCRPDDGNAGAPRTSAGYPRRSARRQADLKTRPYVRASDHPKAGCRAVSAAAQIRSPASVAWHKGVDFAGKEGTDVIATGSGVVTYAGERYGYGNLVEINHGNGITSPATDMPSPLLVEVW